MRAMYTPLTSLPLMLLLVLLVVLMLLGTHLTEAAAVNGGGYGAAVDKEVAPAGVVKTDLLSLEQEIGGNMATAAAAERGTRQARSFLFGFGAGPAWIGGGWGGNGWGYPNYGYYGSPYYNYGSTGYYPGVFGFQKIIIG